MSQKPLISCNIYGQLGNQLFIVAAVLAYAWDYDAEPIFPALNQSKNRASYNRDHLFFRLNTSQSPRPFSYIYRTCLENDWCSSKRIPFYKDLVIDGYFQSWRHFHHHRDKIREIFLPSEETLSNLDKKYGHFFRNPKTVVIHVRTHAKKIHIEGHHPFWGMRYYQKAMESFPSDSIFLIVSDRINWCKHHFSKINGNFVFIEGNSGVEDLFFLAKCKNQILSNSSFSWWAAYLNQNPESLSIFPKDWRDPVLLSNPPAEDFFLPSWKLVECFPKGPYPLDMWDYDKESQSVDNNNN